MYTVIVGDIEFLLGGRHRGYSEDVPTGEEVGFRKTKVFLSRESIQSPRGRDKYTFENPSYQKSELNSKKTK